MKSMLSQQTPVRSLLKIRPMAVGLLDKRKIGYWDALDLPLGDLFRHGAGRGEADGRPESRMDDFLDEVSYASVPAPDTDWSAMPLYMLVDFLTHGHRDLLLQEVGDIQHLLDIHTLSDSGDSGNAGESANLRKLMGAFQAWVKDFQAHIDREESYLFPKILRYEACLKDRNVHPEFHLGSVQDYLAALEAREGLQFYSECNLLAGLMRSHERSHPGSIAAQELAELFERLRDKLNAHHELEKKSLYTAARDLERSLFNKSIDGGPAMGQPRRGPMDSGIMRLDEG